MNMAKKDHMEVEKDMEENIKNLDAVSMTSILIEELKNDNHNVRLFCVRKVTTIAEILGGTRTEEELIPFLIDLIINFEENEEVLLEMSNEFLKLSKYLSNINNISTILRGLELLAGNDDENVRQNATDNLCKLIVELDETIITNEVFPLMQRMIQNDMKSKVSCCYLFPVVYPKLTNQLIKAELVQAFYEISRDDCPSVRRAAAFNISKSFYNLGNFANIEDTDILKDLCNLYTDLLKDSVDIVRVFAIESTKALLTRLSSEQNIKLVRTFSSTIEKDRSWRVKYVAGEQVCDLCGLFPVEHNDINFIPLIIRFLKDPEPEVRSAVLSKFNNIINRISLYKFIDQIIPVFNETISNDNNHHVRAVFAQTIVSCGRALDETNFVTHIFPLISKMLKDEVLEVRQATLENLNDLNKFFNNSNLLINHIIPLFTEISKENKWRLRLALAEKIKNFYDILDWNVFSKHLLPIIYIFYSDHAFEIREQAILCFEKISKNQDDEWKQKVLWEKIKQQLNADNYIFRINGLHSVDLLKNYFNNDYLNSDMIVYITNLKYDNVPNVRLYLAKVLRSLLAGSVIKENVVQNQVKPALDMLLNDADVDVRFYSEECMNLINDENKMKD